MLGLFIPPSERIEWEILRIASAGEVVFAERLDRFVMDGRTVELPVVGVFEIAGGKIACWRDYFATWRRQTS